jgi:hypothetical protein
MIENKKEVNSIKLLHAIRQIPATLISANEKYILTIILSCINIDNITWHSMDIIAEFACVSRWTISRHIKTLEDKKFISIVKPNHYTHDETNHYSLNIDLILSFSVDKSRSKLLHDPKVALQSATQYTQVALQVAPSRVADCNALYNEVEEKRRKKEERKRAREKRVPLSDYFLPNEKLNALIRETSTKSGKSPETLLAKFKNIQKSKDGTSADWNAEYENYLHNEKPQGYVTGVRGQGNTEIKSTVQFYGVGHPDYERDKEIRERAERERIARTSLSLMDMQEKRNSKSH